LLEQGGTTQVRFQPRFGQLLAAAAENVVSIFDVEADRQTHSLRVLVLNLEVEKTNETLLFHVCYLIAIKINNFFFCCSRGTPQRYTLFAGMWTEITWHLSVKNLLECGHWPQESAFMNLVQVGTSSILVFSIRAIPLSWLLEATRYICLSYGDDI
jgi:hypothetical protein